MTIKQKFLIEKVEGIIERADEYASGTYNKNDPTHYSKSTIQFENYEIHFNDCTWGVEITIYEETKEVASLYFTDNGRSRDEIVIRENWEHKWFKLFDRIIAEVPVVERYQYEDDGYGCLSDYE